jgi:hypothetical protein
MIEAERQWELKNFRPGIEPPSSEPREPSHDCIPQVAPVPQIEAAPGKAAKKPMGFADLEDE